MAWWHSLEVTKLAVFTPKRSAFALSILMLHDYHRLPPIAGSEDVLILGVIPCCFQDQAASLSQFRMETARI